MICEHFDQARVFATDVRECKECVDMGSRWVHLRLCLTCGHVGCCDSSPNKHASNHFHATGDPVMRSLEPGEVWGFCFVDDLFVEELPV
ncbi:MAG TPA: UBP-type zinc finger domain-containing protein [Actinomycetota bacterium]|nr:UBP-type zinc finger domain-containing protein [Actinomycetota bacterium]